jgi:hypothetical protein
MPTDVFGRGHVVVSAQHVHEDVGMAPVFSQPNLIETDRSVSDVGIQA